MSQLISQRRCTPERKAKFTNKLVIKYIISIIQVCSDDNSFTLDNEADSGTAANIKSIVGTDCLVGIAAGSTDFSGDYIEISGKDIYWVVLYYVSK